MKNRLFILLFCVILLIPLVDLLHPGFPVTHDGQDHIVRIANFFINLQQGILVPRWAPNLDWGYGHPILMFLYPLPSYIASVFHILSFSLIDSVKITFALGLFFSGVTMYLWLSSFWTKRSSFIGALLYVFAPYRFVELYVRGDIGENLAFVFVPLVLLFIYKLSEKQSIKNTVLGGLSFALLILAHNAISLMFLPFIILYILYIAVFHVKKKKMFFLQAFSMLALGFGLSAFFWIPGLLEGKYTLRNIVTKGEYKTRFVEFSQLLYGDWNYGGSGLFTVQFGALNWIFLILSILSLPYVWLKKRKKISFAVLLIVYTIFAVFLMLSISTFVWNRFILLQNFQFPWRFLAIIVFTTSVLGAFITELLPKNLQKMFVIVCALILLFISKDYWHAKSYKELPESFFTGIYNGTTDTGESAPIWSVRFMEKQASSSASIIEGSGNIVQGKRLVTKHLYIVNVLSSQGRLVENTLYFPGWRVLVDGKSVPIEFQDQLHRGLITFFVPYGRHSVVVEFSNTKIRTVSNFISIASIISLAILLIL